MILGFLIMAFPFIAVISFVIYGLAALLRKKTVGKQSFIYHLERYIFVAYCMSLFYLTIGWYYPDITFHPEYYLVNLKPFIWTKEVYAMGMGKMIEQLVLNIGMFIPYGLLLPLIFIKLRRLGRTTLIVIVTTVGIESLQYFIGRSADIDDVIMNTLGGIVGFIIFFSIHKIVGLQYQ